MEGTLMGKFGGQVGVRNGMLEIVNEDAEYDYETANVQCQNCGHSASFFNAEEGQDWAQDE